VDVELRVFNKEEDEISQRHLDTATIVGKHAIRCFDFQERLTFKSWKQIRGINWRPKEFLKGMICMVKGQASPL
jgi:hypothetical protein